MCFACLCLLLVSSLFKMPSKPSAAMLSTVPKCKEVVMCLMEKICMLDKLWSDMSYSTVGHEFSVDESIIYIK